MIYLKSFHHQRVHVYTVECTRLYVLSVLILEREEPGVPGKKLQTGDILDIALCESSGGLLLTYISEMGVP